MIEKVKNLVMNEPVLVGVFVLFGGVIGYFLSRPINKLFKKGY